MSKFNCALGELIAIVPAVIPAEHMKSDELREILVSMELGSLCRIISPENTPIGGVIDTRGLSFYYTCEPTEYGYMALDQMIIHIDRASNTLGHSFRVQFRNADHGMAWTMEYLVGVKIVPGRFYRNQQLPQTLVLYLATGDV